MIDIYEIESTLDYEFENKDLLQQAFIRKSFSEEHGGQNNEVLEFIGDKALDLVVIRVMMERFGKFTNKTCNEFHLSNPKYFPTRSFETKYSEGKFTDLKRMLVEKKALANAMDDLGFNDQLIMGTGDHKNHVEQSDSVKEDLFEAIIGAVALDCDWNMDDLTNVVSNMIDFDAFFNNEEDDYDQNYVGLVQEWSQNNGFGLPLYQYEENDDGYDCFITIGDDIVQTDGWGESKSKARMDAAYEAYNRMIEDGLILDPIKQAIGEADYNQSVRQINELVQKKLISKPNYTFHQDYDENGNPVWTCKCIIDEVSEYTEETSSSKAEAKRIATYYMLLTLLNEDDDEQWDPTSPNDCEGWYD